MIRLVLAPGMTRDDLDDLAFLRGYKLLSVVPAAAERPAQAIFRAADQQTLVYVIDDARATTPVVVVQGPGEAEVSRVMHEQLQVILEEPFVLPGVES